MKMSFASIAAVLVLCIVSTACCDEPQSREIDLLKREVDLLKKEKLQLEAEVAELKQHLSEAHSSAKPKSGKRTSDPASGGFDPLAVGTAWSGHLDGRDARGTPFHQVATGVVTARSANAFELRVTINDNLEWIYNLSLDKSANGNSMYRISKATLTRTPPNFPTQPGGVRINSSAAVLVKNGKASTLEIKVVRPVGKSGVTATYSFEMEK